MSISNPKQALYEQFAAVAKALGNSQRLELIEHLAQGARNVETLAAKLGLPISNVSQHLQIMRRAGLVTAERKGKFVTYCLSDENVLPLFASLRTVAERQNSEVERIVRVYFETRDQMEPITREELSQRLRDGVVTVIDVRPPDEFALGHVPGAINVPLGQLGAWMSDGGTCDEIVAYCRGPWCVLSFEAVAALRARGYNARRLEDGMPEWKAAGLPVQNGEAWQTASTSDLKP